MKISILVPTYNGENYIGKLLERIISQDYNEAEKEIIIVDSSSTDNTVRIVNEKFPMVKVLEINKKDFNHGTTRNLLAKNATGDFLLFMTQDALPFDENLLKNLIYNFDESTAIVYARQIPYDNASDIEYFARLFNYPENDVIKDENSITKLGIKTFFNSNVCSMYQREVFFELGMFPEGIILNEDMVMASKAILSGYKVKYNSAAKVYHSHNYNLIQQFKRYFDIGMAFKETKYLLEHASNEKEGLRFVVAQIQYLLTHNIRQIPYFFIETIIKFVGYKLGKVSDILPMKIRRKFSAYMN